MFSDNGDEDEGSSDEDEGSSGEDTEPSMSMAEEVTWIQLFISYISNIYMLTLFSAIQLQSTNEFRCNHRGKPAKEWQT